MALESCLAALSYSGLQSALMLPSCTILLLYICIAAKAIMALLTSEDSAAIVPKKARVEAHFGPISTGVKMGGISICRKVLTR